MTRMKSLASQRILTSMGKSLANVVNLGKSHSHRNYSRCIENSGSQAEDVPNLRLLPKVHKPPAPGGHPQSRPMVAAASGLFSRSGDLVSDILEPLVATNNPRQEDQSTEEVISRLEEAEQMIQEKGMTNVMAGSLDVRALYPSLDQDLASEAVAEFIRRSKVEMKGIDYREVQVFLASNLDEHEQKRERIKHLLPRRTKRMGRRPGPTTLELRQKDPDPAKQSSRTKESLWMESDPDNKLTEQEKRLLFSIVIKTAIRLIFKHHLYVFAGEARRQTKGGPIGLRLTSLVARIVMDGWMEGFLTAVTQAGMEILAAMKYVDDVNLVMSMLPTRHQMEGWRVCHG